MDFSDILIQRRLEVLSTSLDSGAAYSELRLYDGAKPTPKGGAITTQKMLVKFMFPKPAKASLVGNTLTLNNPPAATVVVTGLATWGRLVDGDGNFLADMIVSQPAGAADDPPPNGVPHGTGDVWLDKTQLYMGGEVDVSIGTFSEA